MQLWLPEGRKVEWHRYELSCVCHPQHWRAVLGKFHLLTQIEPRDSSVVCRAWLSIRSCFSRVPGHSPAPASTAQSWTAVLSSLPVEQRPGKAPHPVRGHGPAAPSMQDPSCLSPWLPGRQERGPVGWHKAPKVLSQADRYSAEGATSP